MTYKILTVDDSRTIRMIVKNAFKGYDCELFEAENGRDGLALAAKEKPHVIILDITMPVMTGIEMLRFLINDNTLKDTAVIMLTAESGRDHIMKIVKMGVKDYMVKPFKGEQLVERVKLILDLKPRMQETSASERNEDRLFSVQNDVVVLHLPAKIKHAVIAELDNAVKEKTAQMTAAGAEKLILDISGVEKLTMATIQLIIDIINHLIKAKVAVRLVSDIGQAESMRGFKETSLIPTLRSIGEAIASY